MRRRDMTRFALYAGGFLGPLGGGVVTVIIPELRHELSTTTTGAGMTLTAYLVPFALLQLVSGTVGERWGRARTVRAAYVAYAVVSVALCFTDSLGPFLALRALQGVTNAFFTPLLMASLADATEERNLGRAMGTYASMQTAGVVLAPLVGGMAALVDYRLAFLAPAAAGLALACVPLPAAAPREGPPPTLRSALTPATLRVCAAALLLSLCTIGLTVLVALRAADAFGVDSGVRGLILAGFGAAGVLGGRAAGGLVDRLGPRRVGPAAAAALAATVPLVGIVGTPALVALVWFAAGLAAAFLWSTVYVMTVAASPHNRGGAFSVMGAARHSGTALGPLLWLPLYHAAAWLPFGIAGVAVAAAAALAVTAARVRGRAQASIA